MDVSAPIGVHCGHIDGFKADLGDLVRTERRVCQQEEGPTQLGLVGIRAGRADRQESDKNEKR